MSSYESVVVEVDKEGKVKVLTKGFLGPSCVKEHERLVAYLKSLGLEVNVEAKQETEEMHQVEKGRVKTQQ